MPTPGSIPDPPCLPMTGKTSLTSRIRRAATASGHGYAQICCAGLRQGEVHLVAGQVAQPNLAGSALHARLGCTEVGTLDEVGSKFGAYVSTTWFQLRRG
jgi:L-amino acid N-acyltransferase YncA